MRDEDGEDGDGSDGDAPTVLQVMVEDEAVQSRVGVHELLISISLHQ